MSFISNLSGFQLAAGGSFILAKITNIGAAVLIMASFGDRSIAPMALGMVITGVTLLVSTFIFVGLSYRQEFRKKSKAEKTIDVLLSDPETRSLLLKRMKKL